MIDKAAQQYEVVLIPQPEGGFVVTVPDLPDVVSEGETREEALVMIRNAIEGYLETLRERGWPLRMGERAFASRTKNAYRLRTRSGRPTSQPLCVTPTTID